MNSYSRLILPESSEWPTIEEWQRHSSAPWAHALADNGKRHQHTRGGGTRIREFGTGLSRLYCIIASRTHRSTCRFHSQTGAFLLQSVESQPLSMRFIAEPLYVWVSDTHVGVTLRSLHKLGAWRSLVAWCLIA